MTGDAAIGELQVISRFGTTTDEKGCLCDADKTTCAVWGDDLKDGFREE
jgi:hypothetical protein